MSLALVLLMYNHFFVSSVASELQSGEDDSAFLPLFLSRGRAVVPYIVAFPESFCERLLRVDFSF